MAKKSKQTEQKYFFSNYKQRCSSLYSILTNRPETLRDLTANELDEMADLEYIKVHGINPKTNRKNQFDDKKESRLAFLYRNHFKEAVVDVLPEGAKSYLDDVFDAQYFGRKDVVHTNQMEKGKITEDDAAELLSKYLGYEVVKNTQRVENDFLTGEYDNAQFDLKDFKNCFTLKSFRKAELTDVYKWQLKGYGTILRDIGAPEILDLDNYKLYYFLLNAPVHIIQNQITSAVYKVNNDADYDRRLKEYAFQIEKNNIFDVDRFLLNNSGYDWNGDFREIVSIPDFMRIKEFDVKYEEGDKEFIESRVTLAREYLVNKEKEYLDLYGKDVMNSLGVWKYE